ncbi:hypothetical protein NXH76_10445 [Blautia schinkii]|nr:hypothetical protein [Blautia schinkii]
MYAIIRQGGGKYYTSTVFAHYDNVSATDDYGKYLDGIYSRFYIVLNPEKTTLIKQYVYDRGNEFLERLVLITDFSHEDWNMDEESGFGEINITNREEILSMVGLGKAPKEFLELDAEYQFEEYNDISTEKDIENLMWVSGGFHDAYIKEATEENGVLRVLFDGTWGCKIELWFSGKVAYDTRSRSREDGNIYWFGATMLIEDDYIYLVDEENMCVQLINENFCWFKARYVKYRVIPD